MSGLLRRLTRRRAATADEPRPSAPEYSEPDAASPDTPAEAGGQPPLESTEQPTRMIPATGDQPAAAGEGQTTAAAGDPATGVQPAPAGPQPSDTGSAPARDLPAGVDPGELELAPAPSARRGRLRRRLRYLRRARELLLRDLGGFTYEVHRTAGGAPRESHRRLAEAKASRLAALDAEVRELEGRLSEPHVEPVLREPGVGGTCPECGELHASDAHYCARCGAPLDAKARSAREAAIRAAAQPTTGAHPTPEPQPASVLWAAGPRPRAQTPKAEAPEAAQPKTSMATSEWLAATGKPTATPPGEATGGPDESKAPDGDAADESKAPDGDAADESKAPDGEAADESKASGAGEPAEEKPKATRRPSKRSKKAPEEAPGDAGPNGRRDEDVPPPVTSADPLGSPGERRP